MQLPDEEELLIASLKDLEDLPEGLSSLLLETLSMSGDRAAKIRRALEEATRG